MGLSFATQHPALRTPTGPRLADDGLRFEVVRRSKGDLLDQIEARGMFSLLRRPVLHQRRGREHLRLTSILRVLVPDTTDEE